MVDASRSRTSRIFALLISFVTALLFLLGLSHVSTASSLAADLSNSAKMVDKSEATAGETLHYTIVISNSAADLVNDVAVVTLTDVLPADLILETASLAASGGISGELSSSGNAITWTGSIDALSHVTIAYDAVISTSAVVSTIVDNIAHISGSNIDSTNPFTLTASTTIISPTGPITYYVYMPTVEIGSPELAIFLAAGPDLSNQWTVSWVPVTGANANGTITYELQESLDPNFGSFETLTLSETSIQRQKQPSLNNVYYYRVRAIAGEKIGNWSNVVEVYGIFLDDFNDSTSGWDVIRRDTDDSSAETYYTPQGYLNLRVDGRWDYQVSSSFKKLPELPYRIDTRVRLFDQSNLHSYGIVFNGSYDESITSCAANNYTPCFNTYYRLLVIWYGASSNLRATLKRIDYHDSNNSARGPELAPNRDPNSNSPSQTWQDWAVERYPDGMMRVYLNGVLVYEVFDATFFDPYFGLMAATDEYAGLDAQFDYVRVTPLR